jgi:hypothetical protein
VRCGLPERALRQSAHTRSSGQRTDAATTRAGAARAAPRPVSSANTVSACSCGVTPIGTWLLHSFPIRRPCRILYSSVYPSIRTGRTDGSGPGAASAHPSTGASAKRRGAARRRARSSRAKHADQHQIRDVHLRPKTAARALASPALGQMRCAKLRSRARGEAHRMAGSPCVRVAR